MRTLISLPFLIVLFALFIPMAIVFFVIFVPLTWIISGIVGEGKCELTFSKKQRPWFS